MYLCSATGSRQVQGMTELINPNVW